MARPQKEINEELVEKLAAIGCTNEEIAEICNCSADTIERRFAGTLKEARGTFKMSLRRLQYLSAKKGNVSMQIWLGKQYLGQKDKQELSADDVKPFVLAYTLQDLKDDKESE